MPAFALIHQPLFDGLPDSLLQHLEHHLTPWPSDAGRMLFVKGDPENFVAFVQTGHVYHSLVEPGGREVIIDYTSAGGMVGECALLLPRGRDFTAQLSRDCRLFLLHQRHFAPLQQDLLFMSRVHQQISQRLKRLSDFMESSCLYRLEARLARHLLNHMGSGEEPEVLLPGNQSILAAMLNASRPRINTLLQQWQRDGLIQPRRNTLRIANSEQLRRIAIAERSMA
jgi:CRP/FNR family transcriptional regulator, cyclic AMP receptor protein